MLKPISLLILISSFPLAARAAGPLKIFVAPNGNDAWSGRLAAPEGGNGPYATLTAARDKIRRLKKRGKLPVQGVVVELEAGLYELPAAVQFTPEDSGTALGPIVYQAKPGAEVRLSGGKQITNFDIVSDSAVLMRLDESARGNVVQADLRLLGITDMGDPVSEGDVSEFFFNDRPMTVARWPNTGYANIADVAADTSTAGKFIYEGKRPQRWLDEKAAYLFGYWYWNWAEDRERIESIDPAEHSITLARPWHPYGYKKGARWYAFNLLCELDQPGEYVIDREGEKLYFWPHAALNQGHPTISVAANLVRMEGASHILFSGFILEACMDSAMVINNADGVQVSGCTLRNVGGWGVKMTGVNSGVAGCEIYNSGEGGVWLAGGKRSTLEAARLYANNNHIYSCARLKPMYQPAIRLEGVGNAARHNQIHDAPHRAIDFGGNNHVIEYNEIYDVCKEANDAGAIYAGRSWSERGTVIRYNYLHDLSGLEGKGCVGVYLDDQFSGVKIYSNLFYKVSTGVMIGGGRDCVVSNNIFAYCLPAIHVDGRGMAEPANFDRMSASLDQVPYRQEPWASRYPALAGILEDDPMAPKGNVISKNICVGGRFDGFDAKALPFLTLKTNFVNGNQRFVNEAKKDFRLKAGAPALKAGFKPLPLDQIGLVNDADRVVRKRP